VNEKERSRRALIALVLGGLASLAGGLVLSGPALQSYLLKNRGKVVHARVTATEARKQPIRNPGLREYRRYTSETRYIVWYSVLTPDALVQGQADVSQDEYRGFSEKGRTLPVIYLPGAPEVSQRYTGPITWGRIARQAVYSAVFVFLGLGLWAYAGYRWREKRMEHEIRASGVIARATVKEAGCLGRGWGVWQVRYVYRDRAGRAYEGSQNMPKVEVERHRAGDVGLVRIHPKRPQRSLWLGKESEIEALRLE